MTKDGFQEGVNQVSGWDAVCAVSVFVAVDVLLMGYVSYQVFLG